MADDGSFSKIWEDACKEYKVRTGRDISKDKGLTKLQTVNDLLNQIEFQNSKYKVFREKKKKIWGVLAASMQPVEVLSRLGHSAMQGLPFGSASAVFTAVSYLVASAKGVSDAYGSITGLLEKLADFSDRLQEYSQEHMDSNLRMKVTKILATLLEIFAESERIMNTSRLKEFGRVVFLGKDDRVEDAMKRLENLVSAEASLVVAKTYSTTVNIDKEVGRISALQLESKKEKAVESSLKILNTALYSEAYVKIAETHARILTERQEGSGDWLRSERLYEDWLEGHISTLFILGGPGSGKSFLAGATIAHLFERNSFSKGSSRNMTGFFYIHEDDVMLKNLNTALKTISWMLQERSPVYSNFLLRACSNLQKTVTASETWKNLFLDFFSAPVSQYGDNSVFIVLDGVDEAPRKERETLFKLLKELELSATGIAPPRIRVLVFGRPDLRDDTVFIWEKPIIYIEVSARKTKQDIVNYIKSSVGRVRALSQTREPLEKRKQLRKDIIKKLSDEAHGMFLWVNLMLDQIYDMSRPSQIYDALDKAPRSLSNMIHHAFRRLADDLRGFRTSDFNEILSWVTCAQRPLNLDELDCILRLSPPLGEGVPDLEKRLRDQFASFFSLKRKDGLTTDVLLERAAHITTYAAFIHSTSDTEVSGDSLSEKSAGGDSIDGPSEGVLSSGDDLPADRPDPYNSPFSSTTITFSHASIRDYLTRESDPLKREFPADLGIGVNVPEAEKHIAITCLKVLTEEVKLPYRNDDIDSDHSTSSDDSESGSSDDGKPTDESDNCSVHSDEFVFDLIDYAADHFMDHLKKTDRMKLTIENQETITRNLMKLCTWSDALTNWIDGITDFEDFSEYWLGSEKNGEWVRGWLISQMTKKIEEYSYSDKEKSEMKRLSESDQVLLGPFAVECAKRWLEDDKEDYAEGYVCFLDCFVQPQNDGSGKNISEARLKILAEFADLTKTSDWHSNLGEALRIEEHLDAAFHHLQRAIKLNNKNWIAMGRLSFCYEDRELWESAIEWSRKAVEACPKHSHKAKKSEYWRTISFCSLEISDYAQAKEAAKQACLLEPENGSALSTYILALDAAMDTEELMAYIEKLQTHMSTDEDKDLLTIALLANDSLCEVLGHAASRQGNKLDFFISAAYTACDAALKDEDQEEYANQQLLLGQLLYTHKKGEKEVIELWESALRNKEASCDVLESASANLSEIYYKNAVKAETNGGNPRSWVSKMEKLAKYNSRTQLAEASGSALVLGLWFSQHDKPIEAKKCCYDNVAHALDLLSNPDSDMSSRYAWTNLASACFHANDRRNAETAYAIEMESLMPSLLDGPLLKRRPEADVTGRNEARDVTVSEMEETGSYDALAKDPLPDMTSLNIGSNGSQSMVDIIQSRVELQKVEAEAQPAQVTKITTNKEIKQSHPGIIDRFPDAPAHPANQSWYCDGLCRRKASSWKELHICEICLDSVCFCELCIELLKKNQLQFKVCDPDHVFYRAYPIPEEFGKTEDGKLKVGVDNQPEDFDEFLSRVRKEWKEAISTV